MHDSLSLGDHAQLGWHGPHCTELAVEVGGFGLVTAGESQPRKGSY